MALIFSAVVSRNCIKSIENKILALTISASQGQIRERHKLNPKPKLRNPTWFVNKNRKTKDDFVTPDNQAFLSEVVQDQLNAQASELKKKVGEPTPVEWQPHLKRPGVIARKIGIYPMWLKNGQKVTTTLLEVLDNHVIKNYPVGDYEPKRPRPTKIKYRKPCMLIGAEAGDPSLFTKEYCGLFKHSGVVPKQHLARFYISPEAVMPAGTPLTAMHFKVGDYVDVRGKTIDRGFQGVMKRWDFSGMPASHGVTKTHRRPGNIGGGGEKGRVWPGTKMPGHMGNARRILRGLRILRINREHNVLYVIGQAIPGETNSICTIYDTLLPLRQPKNGLAFPTSFEVDETLGEDIYGDDIHPFSSPTIEFDEK